ncbi:TniQ family protein [Hoeflea sp. YIM 152468]|uniref:TniQ family protein n=1 Tax=Hoeflea sp. YIM 152468 TaxID=3031759 RepID=UPI0023DCCCBA|nr:TniQ family protein [Hoeflea sp. YIM 152468]MDF1610040.1 TniQ family protein [Hoeflea sp. YIM 152468]
MVLPVTLEHHDDEAPIGLVVRLAAANAFPSLRVFLDHTETNASAIARGEEEALSLVAEWSGVPADRLGTLASEAGGAGLTWRLGKATFNKDMRPGRLLRFCPDCVLDDRERGTGRIVSRAYSRAWWSVRGIEGCHVHDRKLTEVAMSAEDDPHDFSRFVENNMGLIREEASVAVARSKPMLDRYLVDRVFGSNGSSFLDGVEAHVAAEFSRYLGEFLVLHNVEDGMPAGIDPSERGFRLADAGENSIRNVIAAVIDRELPQTQYVGGILGPMIRWLRRNDSKEVYQPIVDLVQDILERNMPFGPGQTILKPVTSRHLYCVNSAHAEFGLNKERIRTLMAAVPGFRSGFPDARTYFDAAAARPILQAASETLTSKVAAQALGLNEQRMWDLINAGIIEVAEARSDDTRAYARIRKATLLDLGRKLSAMTTPMAADDSLMSLPEAARLWKRPFHNLVSMILDGTLDGHLLEGGEPVLCRVRVKPGGLKLDLRPEAGGDDEWMRIKEVERALGTTTATVSELIGRGYLHVRSIRRETGRTVKLIERRSVSEFESAHISLSGIAKSTQGFRADIKAELEKLGVFPIFEPEGFIARFYRRSALAQVGFEF